LILKTKDFGADKAEGTNPRGKSDGKAKGPESVAQDKGEEECKKKPWNCCGNTCNPKAHGIDGSLLPSCEGS
jgi:hypothetical protein